MPNPREQIARKPKRLESSRSHATARTAPKSEEGRKPSFDAAIADCLGKLADRQQESSVKCDRLEEELEEVKTQLAESKAITVLVSTFAPEPYEVVKNFSAIVRPRGGAYLASFLDAHIHASGETEADALMNLKDIMATLFESLLAEPPNKLGKVPMRQLAVLRQHIRKKAADAYDH
jgi:predicted RNase H-like HicB family nuclease